MKCQTWYALLLVATLLGCQANGDITDVDTTGPDPEPIPTMELELRGWVLDPYSLFSDHLDFLRIHNARVQLIFADEILAETNTDESGYYEFPLTIVPSEGAYLYITSPGYYSNVAVLDDDTPDSISSHLFRASFGTFSGEGLIDAEKYIRLSGSLQEPTDVGGATIYLTNSQNELVGNYTSDGDLSFEMSTVADQDLFLYYEFRCLRGGPIPIGSFSENLDVGTLFDPSTDFIEDLVSGAINATDCEGQSLPSGYGMITRKGQTIYRQETFSYYVEQCLLEDDPDAFLTYITTEPRRYGTATINYSGGDELDLSVEVCADDDTFLRFAIDDGPEENLQLFTFANILPDGRTLLKQINPSFTEPGFVSFELSTSSLGETTADLRAVEEWDIDFAGNDLNLTVQINDGEFIEGLFSGAVFDPFEVLIGNIEGSFRAKIQ